MSICTNVSLFFTFPYIHVHTHTCHSFASFCNLYKQTSNTYKYILWSNMSTMGHLSLKDFKLEIPAICVFVFYLVDRGIITVHASININLFIPLTSPPPPKKNPYSPNSIIMKKNSWGIKYIKWKHLHRVKHNLQKKRNTCSNFFFLLFFQNLILRIKHWVFSLRNSKTISLPFLPYWMKHFLASSL